VEHYDDGDPAGDPAAGAAAIVGLADLDSPPLRLPLGADAVARIRAKAEAVLAGLDVTEHPGNMPVTQPS
jgi:hypothetical protein